ncbi:hypothetical protein F5B22DRAFT_620714 [Xylaria bambusicola]|uniref:uncharacterized protein n=1 Tax=Xylaria bambusicola TaxID=326684 RepID=UPI00200784B3|nr:uncharacterized protein F5B22DRAFT_620714 [Xylaria bambusicola]KAI0508480.1 hypothetical protein F5B22DRAFT_620714 [Xylaria bambusicola]
MPRKVRVPADPAQNRENQQRSRARRKAYVARLEEKVRDYESREMRATLEMQAVAREVAWTNERLRELLRMKGVGREEVDGFLRGCREEGDEGAVCMVSREEAGRDNSSGEEEEEGKKAVRDIVREEGLATVDDAERALSTSCEAAASIIAGFQGHGDVSRVKEALCGDGEDVARCHVKNTRLFQLME